MEDPSSVATAKNDTSYDHYFNITNRAHPSVCMCFEGRQLENIS